MATAHSEDEFFDAGWRPTLGHPVPLPEPVPGQLVLGTCVRSTEPRGIQIPATRPPTIRALQISQATGDN
jgi:hypothetical protein